MPPSLVFFADWSTRKQGRNYEFLLCGITRFLNEVYYQTQVRSLATLVTNWLTHSLTHSLTDSCLVNLIELTLAYEDANPKLVEVVNVADVIDEDRLLQIWKLRFGHKSFVQALSKRFGQDFEVGSSGEILKLSLLSILLLMFGIWILVKILK